MNGLGPRQARKNTKGRLARGGTFFCEQAGTLANWVDFPDARIQIDGELVHHLTRLLGADNVRVEKLTAGEGGVLLAKLVDDFF